MVVSVECLKQWYINKQRLVEMGLAIADSGPMSAPEPFDSKARRAHLAVVEEQLDREAYGKLVDTEADQTRRGVSAVGFHPVCDEVLRLAERLVDAALQFDEGARDYELKRLQVRGSCENPFSESREAESFQLIARKIDNTAAWIRSKPIGKRLWCRFDQQQWDDRRRIEKHRVERRLRLEYQKRRASFDLEVEKLRRVKGGEPQDQDAQTQTIASKVSDGSQLEVFKGGKMVFYADHVNLCGITICDGPRSETRRRILDLLRRKRPDGHFVAYSCRRLAAELDLKGSEGTVVGAIRHLRDDIVELLQTKANLICERKDVILSGGPGYRFADCVSVHDGDLPETRHITDMGSEGDVPNVLNVLDDNVPNVPNGDVPNVREDAAEERRIWILQRLAEGHQLRAPNVAKQFKCSGKTAQRDLQGLKKEGKIEFVGVPRTGYYRLRKPLEPGQ